MADAGKTPFFTRFMSKEWMMFFVVAIGSAIGLGMGLTPNRATPSSPLRADPNDLDFGTVWEQLRFPWSISITNTTNEDLVIERIYSTCSCAVADVALSTIRAGGTREIRLEIDLTKNRQWTPGATEYPFAVDIIPEVRGFLPGGIKFNLRGKVLTAYSDLPRTIRWIDDIVEGIPDHDRTIDVHCVRNMRDLTVVFPEAEIASVHKVVGSTGTDSDRVFQFAIQPRHDLPYREHVIRGSVTGILANGEKIPAVPLEIRAHVRPYVSPSENYAAFGVIAAGTVARREIRWHSADGRPFQLVAISSDSSDAEAKIVSSDRVAISLNTSAARDIHGSVDVTIESALGTRTVRIPVQGRVVKRSDSISSPPAASPKG